MCIKKFGFTILILFVIIPLERTMGKTDMSEKLSEQYHLYLAQYSNESNQSTIRFSGEQAATPSYAHVNLHIPCKYANSTITIENLSCDNNCNVDVWLKKNSTYQLSVKDDYGKFHLKVAPFFFRGYSINLNWP